jgi:hypothetical protein
MRTIAMLGAIVAFAAAPLSAQGKTFRTGDVMNPDRLPSPVMGQVLGDDQEDQGKGRKSGHVPPGHLPPEGMCRIWVDGVPPGQQPAPTDCATAVATKPANARVLWGDQSAFPGKGKGKSSQKGKTTAADSDRGVLGSVIPSASHQKAVAKRGKGKGRG